MTFQEFAKYIKTKRESLFLTQKEMAYKISINQSTYNKIENGKQEPTFSQLIRISKELEIDLTEILQLKKPNSKEHKAYFD